MDNLRYTYFSPALNLLKQKRSYLYTQKNFIMKTVKYVLLLLAVAVSFSSCIVEGRGGYRHYHRYYHGYYYH